MVSPVELRPGRTPRTEEQIVGAMAGHLESGLRVTLAGETHYIRPLRVKAERTWKDSVGRLVAAARELTGDLNEEDLAGGLAAILGSNVEDVLDLITEFDRLGGGTLSREWLEDNAYGTELRAALEVLLDSVYPPMPGGGARPGAILLGLILAGEAIRSASAASTRSSSTGSRSSTGQRTSKRR